LTGRSGPLRLAAAALGLVPALAVASEPLYVKNLSPLAGLLGLPSQRSARPLPAGQLAVALQGSVANNYVHDDSTTEFVNFDGETRRLALELRYGFARDWDVQLEIPWLEHGGGDLDKVIDDWHDLWDMSDGGRSQVSRDLLDYRYATTSEVVGLGDDASGVGDISLALSHAFYRQEAAAAAIAVGYKFGSGDEEDWLGSGADDVFVALRLSGEHLSELPLSWHGQAGYLRAGDSDLLGRAQQRDLWFAGIAMDWRVAGDWSLLAQVDAHAAPLDSGLTATGDDAFLLTGGVIWRFAPRWCAQFSLVEDIAVETAPDVSFQAGISYRTGD